MKNDLRTSRKVYRYFIYVLFVMLQLQVSCVYGQQESEYSNMRKTLDIMFEHLDKKSVPTGLLRDYAVESENLDKYDKDNSLNSDNLCDVLSYAKVLSTLKSASLLNNPFSTFEEEINKSKVFSSKNSTVRLSVVLYEYAQIKANALTDKLISYKQGQVYCSSKNAYQLRELCAGCILDNSKTTNDVVFSLPQHYLLTNIGITKVEIDYGKGYECVLNNKISARLDDGTHIVKIRITDNKKKTYLTYSSFVIYSKHSQQTRSNYRSNTYTWTGLSYNGVITHADVTIKRASNNNSGKIKKPFIFVEGFDPRELNPFERGSMNEGNVYDKWKDFIESNNYDYIYVDWQEPGEYIQANAYALIKILKNIKSLSDDNSEPIFLIGHSMGGLIARYALKTMESQSISHGVGTYVSYDSPHLGANIPLGLLYGFHGIRKFLNDKKIISSLADKFAGVNKLLALGECIAYSTAAQQMLVNYVDPAGYFNNTEHIHWQKELNQLGFPQGDIGKNFQMLAIANSNYSPIKIPDKYIYCDFSAGTNIGATVFPLLSLAIGIGLQDVIAGLLCVLPGRDSVKGVFECLPATSIRQKVTHIKIGYKKRFLWVVPLSKTVFSYNKYYNSSCLYDTYSSSMYNVITKSSDEKEKGIPVFFNYGYDTEINPIFPFIPTSSALACGDGINSSPTIFTTKPTDNTSSFGLNYYLDANPNSQGHSKFSPTAQYWIKSHLGISIDGPLAGYTGAKYSLTESVGAVYWSSSNTSVSTINKQGVLFTKGNGVTQISARYNGISYSKTIIVGLPRYILSAAHEPNGFKIDATCMDTEFKPHLQTVNRIIRFHWGVKFPDKTIEWRVTNEPSIFVPLEDKNAVIFFKMSDGNGNESTIQSIQVNAYNVFHATNNHLKVDANRNIYKDNETSYSYKYGKVYLTRDSNLPSKYQHDIWTSTKALVFSPFASQYTVSVSRGEMSIKNILPQEELDYIINNSENGQGNIYTIALLNPEDKIIQFLPFTITLK